MSEIRMEVISESEAREYCNANNLDFITCYLGKGNDAGKLMMLAESKELPVYESPEYLDYLNSLEIPESKSYVVQTSCDKDGYTVSTMYVAIPRYGARPVTFDIKDAKRFTKREAETKAFYMTKQGKYCWKAIELGG